MSLDKMNRGELIAYGVEANAEIERLRAANAELVEALEYALWDDTNGDTWTSAAIDDPQTPKWVKKAFATLAKAKGK